MMEPATRKLLAVDSLNLAPWSFTAPIGYKKNRGGIPLGEVEDGCRRGGFRRNGVEELEAGVHDFTVGTLHRLATALGVQ